MPDSKITELALGTMASGDLVAFVSNPSGAPVTQKGTIDSLVATVPAATITVENEATDTTSFPLFVTSPTGTLEPKTNAGLAFNASNSDLKLGGSIFVSEKAAANTDVSALGQFWVRDDVPNLPMFTDDNGTDFILTQAGAATITVTDESADTTSFLLFATAPTGALEPKSNSGLTFNALTSDLSATLIAGIANENLLDKTAVESIPGQWTFTISSTTFDSGTIFNGPINLRSGQTLNIADASNTDKAVFSHDGTDFNTVFFNTADWNISDVSTIIIEDGGLLGSAVYNNQTGTTYTILASDNGKILTFDNAASIAVTLPDTLDTNFQCVVIQLGVGVPTVTPNTDTINDSGSGVSPSAQFDGLYLSQYAATTWVAII